MYDDFYEDDIYVDMIKPIDGQFDGRCYSEIYYGIKGSDYYNSILALSSTPNELLRRIIFLELKCEIEKKRDRGMER